mmetsp:Transcript_8536/g.16712  ORF Transcript_8536/g.16712 Transcript_8536/m.16712 type:complete len:222 (+) Transcript_8536:1314-1979(+)
MSLSVSARLSVLSILVLSVGRLLSIRAVSSTLLVHLLLLRVLNCVLLVGGGRLGLLGRCRRGLEVLILVLVCVGSGARGGVVVGIGGLVGCLCRSRFGRGRGGGMLVLVVLVDCDGRRRLCLLGTGRRWMVGVNGRRGRDVGVVLLRLGVGLCASLGSGGAGAHTVGCLVGVEVAVLTHCDLQSPIRRKQKRDNQTCRSRKGSVGSLEGGFIHRAAGGIGD